MKWHPLLQHAVQAIWQQKLRSLLSMLGIVFAVIALVAMLAIAEGAKRETLAQIHQLGTNNIVVRRGGRDGTAANVRRRGPALAWSDVRALERRVPEAGAVAPVRETNARVRDASEPDTLDVLAVDSRYQGVMNLPVREGRFICAADVARRQLVCVLGAEAAAMVGREGYVGGTVRLGEFTYRVVGILRARRFVQDEATAVAARNFNRTAFVPLGADPRAVGLAHGSANLTEIVVKVRQGHNVRAVAAVIRRILAQARRTEDFQIIVPQELLLQAQRTQWVFNVVLGGIAGISLLVGGIGIMNVMLASVSERTKEIGIRRSVGASEQHIAAHFLAEAVVLTLVGGAVGVVLGVAGAKIVSLYAGWSTAVTPWALLLALLMAGGVGILSGLYPALRAARLNPVDALRYE